jgi:uncharacterized protein with NAD-binding domain and iron-sulfur cluster
MTNAHGEKDKKYAKSVAIFGAGIAGLTAAHELIERGFRVEIYESEEPSPLDDLNGKACAIGGMARTQWSRIERVPPTEKHMPSTQRIATHEERQALAERIYFENDAKISDNEKKKLERIAKIIANHRLPKIEVRGFADQKDLKPYPEKSAPKRLDLRRAQAVTDALDSMLKDLRFRGCNLIPRPLGLGHRDDWSKPGRERNYVDFHVIEDLIPGEHGFRFFPNFYRNLFDTMRRTPIAADQAVFVETPRTVLDDITRTEIQRVGHADAELSFNFPRRPVTSLQEAFEVLTQLLKSNQCTLDDLVRFQLKLFKYMTSCPERRAAEYESQSWWDFVEGERYSENFRRYVYSTGQMLVAADAETSDARSFGTAGVQLLLDHLRGGAQTDGTLNGPTSLVWFDHWRRYLETQGVEFYRGVLKEIQVVGHTVWPVVHVLDEPDEPTRVLVRDYYVIAVDVVTAQELVKHSELQGDDFNRLRRLELGDLTEAKPDGALQHISGIQYYFNTDVRFVEGHTDYADSEWGLTSISQPQFWTRRRGWWSGYRGVLSVDIGNWFAEGAAKHPPAWESTKDEIAEEVWRQIKKSITKKDLKETVCEPLFYHLDECIEFERGARKLPSNNCSPYLITRPGEYATRPGKPGAYQVHYGKLALAGTYMQTYTRLTTMEAANESARHAVNAILEHTQLPYERCRTWNPEDHEAPELRYLIDLDRKLSGLRLPHFVDILDMREVPRALLRAEPDLGAIGLKVGGRPAALVRAAGKPSE